MQCIGSCIQQIATTCGVVSSSCDGRSGRIGSEEAEVDAADESRADAFLTVVKTEMPTRGMGEEDEESPSHTHCNRLRT